MTPISCCIFKLKVTLNAHYKKPFLNFAKICIVLCLSQLSQFGNEKLGSPSSFLSYKDLKRKLRVFLAGHIVVMVTCYLKAGVNVKAVFTSPNTAFLPISRSRFKRRQIPMLITLSTIWQFCVNFWVMFRCFGKERFFLKG